jgi:hypothetical protein
MYSVVMFILAHPFCSSLVSVSFLALDST